MLKIRYFESMLLEYFHKGIIHGTTHTSVGQEDIAVFISEYIDKNNDKVFSNHRNHAHYLAISGDYKGLLNEILGKPEGVCGGAGGSQQIGNRYFFSAGIVGSLFPVAAGVAFAKKKKKEAGKIVLFIGEGAFGQGVFYEMMNFASLHSLPIVFIIEDNGISQSTKTDYSIAGTIKGRAEAFGVEYYLIKDKLVDRYKLLKNIFDSKTSNLSKPILLHFLTIRINSHSVGVDSRSKKEIDLLQRNDPIRELISTQIEMVENKLIQNEIREVFTQSIDDC